MFFTLFFIVFMDTNGSRSMLNGRKRLENWYPVPRI